MKKTIHYFIPASLFLFFTYSEYKLAKEGNILWDLSFTTKVLLLSLGFGILFCLVLHLLSTHVAPLFRKHIGLQFSGVMNRIHFFGNKWTDKKVMGLSFLLLVLAWMPAYLAYYPGILAYDSPIQFGMIFEGYMIDHHPIAHTLLLKAFVLMGSALFHNVNAGVGAYTFFQLLVLAASFAFAVGCLYRVRRSPLLSIFVILLFMFFPLNHYMAVSMTKDTLFTACLMITVVSLCMILQEDRQGLRPGKYGWLYFLGTLGGILFRNNYKFSVMVLVGILLILCLFRSRSRVLWGKLFLLTGTSLVLGMLLLSFLFRATNAQQGDRREMLCLPIQQFARCALYHGGVGEYAEDDGTMDPSHMSLINDFLLDEAYRLYNPAFADPVKGHTNTYVARYRSRDFITTYFSLLAEYPGDFLNAFLAVNAGYLSPLDTTHARIFEYEDLPGKGYIQTYWAEENYLSKGIHKNSVLPTLHRMYETWADQNAYLHLPILKYILVPGSYLYFYLFLAATLLKRKKYAALVPVLLLLSYMATLLLGPVVQMRYLFPLMAVFPPVALLCCHRSSAHDSAV